MAPKMIGLVRVKASEPVDRITSALLDEGAVIVEELLDGMTLDRFNAELEPLLEMAEPDLGSHINDAVTSFLGKQMRHVTGLAGKSGIFATEILGHPIYEAACQAALRPHSATYQLNVAHVLDRGPGLEQQPVHRDEWAWLEMPNPHPQVQLASVLALVDFTADNGATRVVPGSHRWHAGLPTDADLRWPAQDEIVAAEMKAGSAVIYLGSTFHAGGTNVTSDEWRRGMHVSYCAGWLRTEENQYLATPIETVRQLPPRCQELLGYGIHTHELGSYLGAVELQDPVGLIAAGRL
jgi:ectoine hydroxylase-related dioxygenase (phytanoyl-CoA dioxygenase family)